MIKWTISNINVYTFIVCVWGKVHELPHALLPNLASQIVYLHYSPETSGTVTISLVLLDMTLAWKNPEAKHCRSCREAHQFENFLGRRKGAWQMGELSGMELLGGMWVYIPDWKRKNAVKTILFMSILAECFCLACILKPRKETAHAIWISRWVSANLTFNNGLFWTCFNGRQDWNVC